MIVVDVITERHDNLHAELTDLLRVPVGNDPVREADLYAVAYRTVLGEADEPRLEIWPETLAVGRPLPTLPLWLTPGLAVPVDFEATYAAAGDILRIPR